MVSNRTIVVVCCLLVVVAIVAYGLDRRIRASGMHLSDFVGAVSHKLQRDECADKTGAATPQVPSTPIAMVDATVLLGEGISTKTFALAVADINSDQRDDILIGAHEKNPYLLINTPHGFKNESGALFSNNRQIDRHGYTFADLDNDGDLDLAIACGGQDGVGAGAPNLFFKNATENGVLRFVEEQVDADIAEPAARTRALIPIASPDGRAVNLYAAALARNGYPNRLFRNTQEKDRIQFATEPGFLTLSINDHGRGVIADFDRDGSNDYLVVEDWMLKLYWHPDSGRGVTTLAYDAFSTTVADFNNDGLLDIFLGTFSKPSLSDTLTYNGDELIYVVYKHGAKDVSAISFKADSPALKFNLDQLIPATMARPAVGAQDIFLGRNQENPKARAFSVGRRQAAGEPESFDRPGIYIWYSKPTREWNMKWVFHDSLDDFKGLVRGAGIADVNKTNFTTHEPAAVTDAIFINQGNGGFAQLCTGLAPHAETTSDAAVADFNNDGWLDVIGLRQAEQGAPNGDLFVLTNNGGASFSTNRIAGGEQERLHRSDLIAFGFFDDDDKPDIVFTNGFGQIPGNEGLPQLMLNKTATDHKALLVELQGTNANRSGIGAKLTLTDAAGHIVGYRVQGINSNISQDSHWLQFGLGEFAPPYKLQVEWPDNTTSEHSFAGPSRNLVKQ
jgi:hypothetical protein